MRNSVRCSLRALLGVAVLVPAFALAGVAVASAQVAGPKILSARGGTTDNNGDDGHIAMGGLAVLDNSGGAKSLNFTIAYLDNPNTSGSTGDDFVCEVTTPSDLSYSISKGVGTLTLTLSKTDPCYKTVNPSLAFYNTGKSISFQVYALGSKLRMVSTQSSLVDGEGDTIDNLAVSGEMNPSGSGSSQATGVRFVSGEGGAVESDDRFVGHIALAGLIALSPMKKKVTTGTAKSLDLTLTYEDTDSTNQSCHLTDPNDVSYTLNKGVGTLTLTVGTHDTCTVANSGKSLNFDLYAAGASGRLVSTGGTLVDASGDTIIPAVGASFSTAGGF